MSTVAKGAQRVAGRTRAAGTPRIASPGLVRRIATWWSNARDERLVRQRGC
jgi:hypothetical protein